MAEPEVLDEDMEEQEIDFKILKTGKTGKKKEKLVATVRKKRSVFCGNFKR